MTPTQRTTHTHTSIAKLVQIDLGQHVLSVAQHAHAVPRQLGLDRVVALSTQNPVISKQERDSGFTAAPMVLFDVACIFLRYHFLLTHWL